MNALAPKERRAWEAGTARKTRPSAEAGGQKCHYKSLSREFRRDGFHYRLIARVGDAAIYEQRWSGCPNPTICFEVIRIKRRETFQIGDKLIEAAEIYPRSEDWGTAGFTFTAKDAALAKLRELQQK
jgi:hypothetical protein